MEQITKPVIAIKNFQSKTMVILASTDLNELWTEMTEIILENISIFKMNGSGWTFHSIVSLDIHTVRYKPLRGGTYVSLPKFLASEKSLINMTFRNMKRRNEDIQCFKGCIARALNPVKDHPERITGKLNEQVETLKFKNISFPVKLRDINTNEKQNPSISVNVLGYDEKIIYPLRISEMDKRLHEVNLLLLEDKHYVLIKQHVKAFNLSKD